METIKIGGLLIEFLHSKDDTDGSLDLFKMQVEPNARVPAPHYHESWDETVYGLTGTLTMRIDGVDRNIEAGQSAFIPRGVVHSFRNDSSAAASVLNVLTPGILGAGYFRELAGLASAGPPDPEEVKALMLRYRLIPVPNAGG
jgi:quercetin dioxygenase-like cupin family protein